MDLLLIGCNYLIVCLKVASSWLLESCSCCRQGSWQLELRGRERETMRLINQQISYKESGTGFYVYFTITSLDFTWVYKEIQVDSWHWYVFLILGTVHTHIYKNQGMCVSLFFSVCMAWLCVCPPQWPKTKSSEECSRGMNCDKSNSDSAPGQTKKVKAF